MNIYISGISGTGMGPLALMAKQAGHTVFGSDRSAGPIVPELEKENIEFEIGNQDGSFLEKHDVDWFVYTSALPEDHPELKIAREKGLKCSKRDEFIDFLVNELNLKMVAVAGTHGKTTTTSMIIWSAEKLGLKASYLVGTTLGFAESGRYETGDKFFIYEADEYDRNFLKFHPWLSCITFVSYDHPDIYKTEAEYKEAFEKFESQSENIIRGVNSFPGVGRRFEKIAEGVYSDYAHHPEEIEATIEIADEESKRLGRKGVVAIYEPHQNTRQHEVKYGYKKVFNKAEKVFWLPTYLTREDTSLAVLTPEDFIKDLSDPGIAEPAEMNDDLASRLKNLARDGYLILLMTAGPADSWLRKIML